MSASPSLRLMVTVGTVHPGISGGAIFTGQDADGQHHKFVADRERIFRPPTTGESWQVEGSVRRHPRYGVQVHVAVARLVCPSGRLIVDYLQRHPTFRDTGVGEAKANRLWQEFGLDLYAVLHAGDVDALATVLTEETARRLAAAWREVAEETDLVAFLDHHGFDARLANKVRRVWPEDALAALQDNPYRMMAFAPWAKVDAAARALGVAMDDPRRQVAAVEGCLYRAMERRHTVVDHDTLLADTRETLFPISAGAAQAALERAIVERAVIPWGQDGYQALGAAAMEHRVTECLRALLAGSAQPTLFGHGLPPRAASVVAVATRNFTEHRGFTPNAEQVAAVEMALLQPLSVLCGGAGTGKTAVLELVHAAMKLTGGKVIQMALSGRAVQRLREATGREAMTIARFLHHAAKGKGVKGLDQAPLVIVDESSMLDLPTTYRIVRCLPADARLLLCGDQHQLPPIGMGLIFHVLVHSVAVPRVKLTQVHRQAAASGIPQVADLVRQGQVPQLPAFLGEPGAGVSFVDATEAEVLEVLDDVIRALGGPSEEVQTLGVTKRGPGGVESINASFHAIHAHGRRRLLGRGLAEGEPVIFGRNDYAREIWNGSLGHIHRIHDRPENVGEAEKGNGPTLDCLLDGQPHRLAAEDLSSLALAYAITVHKAQGSQFRRVIVPVFPSRLLERTLLYTAITRGMEQVVIIGDRQAFARAVAAQPGFEQRRVGFAL